MNTLFWFEYVQVCILIYKIYLCFPYYVRSGHFLLEADKSDFQHIIFSLFYYS